MSGGTLKIVEVLAGTTIESASTAVIAAAGGAYDPDTDDANMIGAWGMDDETSITDTSGNVSAVSNIVTGGLQSLIATDNPQTGLTAQDINGLNTVYFDRNSPAQKFYTAQDYEDTGTTGTFAIHVVYGIPSTRSPSNGGDCVFGIGFGTRTFAIDAGNATTFPGRLNYTLADGSTDVTNFSTTGWEGKTVAFQVIFDATNNVINVWANNTQVITNAAYNDLLVPSAGFGRFSVGNNVAGNRALQGQAGKAWITSSITNRADYWSHISNKWGIS